MSENYQPKPYQERKSQNLGISGYLKSISVLLYPIVGGLAGWFIGKGIKSPPKADLGKSGAFEVYQTFMRSQFGDIGHEGGYYAGIGAKIGIVIAAFFAWKKHEKQHLAVEDTVREVKDIAHLHRSNEDLEKDNKMVSRMLEFEKRKQKSLQQKLGKGAEKSENFQGRLQTQQMAQGEEVRR